MQPVKTWESENVTGSWPPPFASPPFLHEDRFEFLPGEKGMKLATPLGKQGSRLPHHQHFSVHLCRSSQRNHKTPRVRASHQVSAAQGLTPPPSPLTTQQSSRELGLPNRSWDEHTPGLEELACSSHCLPAAQLHTGHCRTRTTKPYHISPS